MGVDAQGTGGFLRLDPAFAYAEASFLMTFATGGVPHAGSGSCVGFCCTAVQISHHYTYNLGEGEFMQFSMYFLQKVFASHKDQISP